MAAFSSVLAVAGGLMQFGQAYSESQNEKLLGDYQKQQYDFNQSVAELKAQDAELRGVQQEGAIRVQGRQIAGEQRANLAAQGIEINSGSAQAVQDQSQAAVQRDLINAHNNAWREAWGYRVEATGLKFQGEQAQLGAGIAAQNTLLTGGLRAASSGIQAYQYSDAYNRSATPRLTRGG